MVRVGASQRGWPTPSQSRQSRARQAMSEMNAKGRPLIGPRGRVGKSHAKRVLVSAGAAQQRNSSVSSRRARVRVGAGHEHVSGCAHHDVSACLYVALTGCVPFSVAPNWCPLASRQSSDWHRVSKRAGSQPEPVRLEPLVQWTVGTTNSPYNGMGVVERERKRLPGSLDSSSSAARLGRTLPMEAGK